MRIFLKNKKTNKVFEFTKDLTNSFILTPSNFSDYVEIYCGRPSIFGNPYSHLDYSLAEYKTNSIEEAISNYTNLYLPTIKDELNKLKPLENICLICFCVPKQCHTIEIAKKLYE